MTINNSFLHPKVNKANFLPAFARLTNVLLVLVFLISAVGVKPALAWFDGSWTYRIPVTITNPGSSLVDYQISITLNDPLILSHAKSDGSDVRVISGDDLTPLPFWIESWTAGNALILVKLPSIPTGVTTFYLYYGNPAAVALSNGTAVFQAYDGFEDYPVGIAPPTGGLGALQWSSPGGVVVTDSPVQHGTRSLRFFNASSLTGTFTSLAQGSIGAWLRRPSPTGGDLDIYLYGSNTALTAVVGLGGSGFLHYWDGSFHNTAVPYAVDTWYLVTLSLNGTPGRYDFVVYNQSMTELVRVANIYLAGGSTAINRAMFYASSAYTGYGYADDFRVSPLYTSSPTILLGTEELAPPVEGANLVLGQSDSPDPVYTGSPLTYSFEITNLGISDATGVTLTDTLPAGVTFSSASTGCTYNSFNHNVICNIGNLAMNASASLTITVSPTSIGLLNNLATVSANETDPAPANNSAQVQTTVLKGCPCSIWSDATVPTTPAVSEGVSAEFGVKFRANTNGFITGLRFYKGPGNTGIHRGHLWASTGEMLTEITFTGESASGWQEAVVSPPVPITANTTYVASYHTYTGHFAVDYGYFATTGFNNAPLRALADNDDGPNGVFLYGDTIAFPTGTYSSSNYWVDVVFNTTAVDNIPPTVVSVLPPVDATGIGITTAATATFSEGLDPTTVNANTFYIQDPDNAIVSAEVAYTAGSKTATLTPQTGLLESTTYTATLKGGVDGIKDLAGNHLGADYTWSFTTSVPPPPPPDEGPGGPVLIVSSETNPFTRYYVEILLNEGLNTYTASDIRTITAEKLAGYDVVILGDKALSTAQADMFSAWVNAGGQLIAMRPDKKLASLLGLVDASAMLSNSYLLVNTATTVGAGIVAQTIQFHGIADLYTLNGATSLATLYSDSTTATAFPAVTLHQVGTNGGQAAAFTYDLARSVVYTRQGNPAWDGQHRDAIGRGWKTPHDLFYGAATYDPQPDWVDFTKIAIPQADEQQRLLANLILTMNLEKKPLPRFWYLPRGEKAAVLMTGDDHGGNGTTGRFQHYQEISPLNCSVADWECIRSTSYIYTFTPLSDVDAAAFTAAGFDVELHVDTLCSDFSPDTINGFYDSQISAWVAKYISLPVPSSNRTHCVVWSDWASQPKAEASHGMSLDTTYYFFPMNWVQNRPGYFTGSGMPMRFAELDGTRIDVYQAVTQMTDESGQTYPYTIDSLLDRAVGPEGYYGVLTVNAHTNEAASSVSDAVVASAIAHNVPVVSARQMITWLDGRNNSSFGSFSWSGNVLNFTIVVGAGANGLQAMLPTASAVGPLSTITLNANTNVTFITETIKGIEYALFPAVAGVYQATYAVDNTAPVISGLAALSQDETSESISWVTNELSTSSVHYGLTPASLGLNAAASAHTTAHSIQLTGLMADTTYYYRVTSTDAFGNSSTFPAAGEPASFRVPAGRFTETSVADFSGGTTGLCYIAHTTDGEMILSPTYGIEFDNALPSDWYISGGTSTVSNGVLTVDGGHSGVGALYDPGHSLEIVATFAPGENQYLGFGINFSVIPFAIFDNTGSGFRVHTVGNSGGDMITDISSTFLGAPHRYRIDWNSDNVAYYVDGALVASHPIAITVQMRPLVFDRGANNSLVLTLAYLRMTPYGSPCTYTSRVFDAGRIVDWLELTSTRSTPTGTSVSFETRTGDVATPDTSWSAWQAVNSPIASPDRRYIQYRATLTSSNPYLTPALENVTLTYSSTSPTGVDLNYFRAAKTPDGVQLTWETVNEATLAGFNLYRRELDGKFEKINPYLIAPEKGGQPEGYAYTYLDGDAALDVRYEYRLEVIKTNLEPSASMLAAYWPYSLQLPMIRH